MDPDSPLSSSGMTMTVSDSYWIRNRRHSSISTLTLTSAYLWRRDRPVTASSPRLTYYLADGQETRGVPLLILIGPWPIFKRLTNVWVTLIAILEIVESA
jgi:hypothetical protein